jgi:hypothetical protein
LANFITIIHTTIDLEPIFEELKGRFDEGSEPLATFFGLKTGDVELLSPGDRANNISFAAAATLQGATFTSTAVANAGVDLAAGCKAGAWTPASEAILLDIAETRLRQLKGRVMVNMKVVLTADRG